MILYRTLVQCTFIKSYCVTAHNRTVRGGSSGSFFTQNMMEWEQKRQQGIQGISPSAFALAKPNEAKIFVILHLDLDSLAHSSPRR